jgi:hypothetical protein
MIEPQRHKEHKDKSRVLAGVFVCFVPLWVAEKGIHLKRDTQVTVTSKVTVTLLHCPALSW